MRSTRCCRVASWNASLRAGSTPTGCSGRPAVISHRPSSPWKPILKALGVQLRPFDRLRRQRHDAEYPAVDSPQLTAADVRDDIPRVSGIVDIAERVLDTMPVY